MFETMAQVTPVHNLPRPHAFLREVEIAQVPGPSTPLLDRVLVGLLAELTARHHRVLPQPTARTDAFVTTARLHEPRSWREAPLFVGRKRHGLAHTPATYTLVQATPAQYAELLQRFAAFLAAPATSPLPADLPGLAPGAAAVLREQGARGGPLVCLARLLQAQTKSLRVLLVVGEQQVERGHLFDLAGACPELRGQPFERFCAEAALRIVTQLSTQEATRHQGAGEPVPAAQWAAASVPPAMLWISRELGQRGFFTQMVRIADLVEVPALTEAIAQQYSEGCFGSFDPLLGAQVVTVTGSRQPVAKGCLTPQDLAVIASVNDAGNGVLVRAVEGLPNEPPSSEAVEFELMDARLPRRLPPVAFGIAEPVPVVRSKLHGHRGVQSYDAATVEYVPMAMPFHDYLVSCSTAAQAHGIAAAFAQSQALQQPDDPRTVVFTILPGHGLLAVERWVAGQPPFAELLQAIDSGRLTISPRVPQGRCHYERRGARYELREAPSA